MEIAGTYVHDGLTYWITATADPSVVKAHVSHYSLRAHGIDVEMRKSSPTAWDGVLPPHAPGGAAPIHWEFEPGLGAFTSTSPGKPTRRFGRRVATAAAGAGGAAAGWQAAKYAYDAGALATGNPTTGEMMFHAAEFAVGEAVGAAVAAEAAGGGAAAAAVSAGCSIQ